MAYLSADTPTATVFRAPGPVVAAQAGGQPCVHRRKKPTTARASAADRQTTLQRVRLASSLSAEDMVIADVILREAHPDIAGSIDIFTLETGRLPAETLALLDDIQTHYGTQLAIYTPADTAVQAYIEQYGLNGFYESLAARKQCCDIRKVIPLAAALADGRCLDHWSAPRAVCHAWRAGVIRGRYARGIRKYNPLFDWSEQDVWAYVEQFSVPVNALHYQGYPSIGCEPCTKAVRAGEDPRAGRWWWENQDSRECGLHVHN